MSNHSIASFQYKFKKGTVIFHEGDTSKEMYFITEGEIEITKKVHNHETTLVTLTKGHFFGEMSTFVNEPRIATATAKTDSKLLVVQPDAVQSLLKVYPDVGYIMIKVLCNRLSEMDKKIKE